MNVLILYMLFFSPRNIQINILKILMTHLALHKYLSNQILSRKKYPPPAVDQQVANHGCCITTKACWCNEIMRKLHTTGQSNIDTTHFYAKCI